MTWAEIKSRRLNWWSHPDTPHSCCFKYQYIITKYKVCFSYLSLFFGFLDLFHLFSGKSHIIKLIVFWNCPVDSLLLQISRVPLSPLLPSSFSCQKAESYSDFFCSFTHTHSYSNLSLSAVSSTSKPYLKFFYFITVAITLGQITIWPGLMQ